MKCACGCGQDFEPSGKKGTPKRFIPGHQFRTATAQEAYREGKRRQRAKPPPGVVGDGLCQCGCGNPAPIAPTTNRSRGWYQGFPIRFIQGHNPPARGADSPNFKGRMRIDSGYVLVYAPDHPAAYKTPRSRVGYVLEHRLVWEQANGRRPRPDEHVHHINGIRDDNRPENLVALTRSEHRRLHRAEDNITEETRRKLSEASRRAHAEGRIRSPGRPKRQLTSSGSPS